MQQVKLFKGVESDIAELESNINAWLADSGAKVVTMFGNIAPQTRGESGGGSLGGAGGRMYAPSDVLVAILYESA